MIPDSLQRGDIVRVEWVDIFEDVVGDPASAELAHRVSYGVFWEKRASKKFGIPCVVTTTTLEKSGDDGDHSGYCIYPESCVIKISIIRRARRTRKKVAPVIAKGE